MSRNGMALRKLRSTTPSVTAPAAILATGIRLEMNGKLLYVGEREIMTLMILVWSVANWMGDEEVRVAGLYIWSALVPRHQS